MKHLALALLLLSLAVTGAVAKQTCKERADEKKLAGAALNSFMTKCASDATASCNKAAADKKLSGAAKGRLPQTPGYCARSVLKMLIGCEGDARTALLRHLTTGLGACFLS